MNFKKMAVGLAATLIALLLIYFSIPQIKQSSQSSDAKPTDELNATSPLDSMSPNSPPTSAIKKTEPPAILPMPGALPPVPPQKKIVH
jgi:hypothetical protein